MSKRLTYEYVYNYFKENNCKLLSKEYINNRTSLEYICQCGTRDFITLDEFKNGRRCNNCKYNNKENNYKTKSFNEVKKYIENQKYILLSDDYVNCKTHLLVQCPNKHNPYLVSWNNFHRGRRCPECAKEIRANSRRLDFNKIKEYVSMCDGYELLSTEYKNNSTPLFFQCPEGHMFNMDWQHFSRGQRCPECDPTKKKTYEEVKEYIESFDGYELLSNDYINAQTKLEIKCPKSHVFLMNYVSFKSGDRCPYCARCAKKTIEEIREYMNQYGYTLFSDKYINAQKKLSVQCPEGHIYQVNWNNFKNGKRCPICQQSKGEEKIRQYLEQHNIFYQRQYSFDDCRNIEPLRFDFAVFDDSNNLLILIEYDGEYHYFPIEGQKKLKYQQKLDEIKNTYCLKNNILLLRIPYWDFDNIEQILIEHKITA